MHTYHTQLTILFIEHVCIYGLQGMSLCLRTRKYCYWKQQHRRNGITYQRASVVESVPWVEEHYNCWKVCFCVKSQVMCMWTMQRVAV